MADRIIRNAEAPMGLRDHLADESEYSHMVWLTGGSVNLLDADIQIGAVEIKDHDSAIRLDVETVTTKNALYDRSEDGAHVTVGITTDAAASSTVTEDATARTGIGLWKGIKNILILINAKLAALGRAAMAASMPVVIASEQMPNDGTGFTPSTDPYMPIGGEFDDAAPAGLGEGQGGAVRVSNRRELYVTVRDAAGNERGLNIDASGNLAVTVPGDYPEDSPHSNEDVGLFVLSVRNDSGSVMSDDGDYSVFMTDANGRLYVKNDALDKDTDEVLVWANTAKDGTGTDYVPLVDNDGHLQVDVLSALISSGSIAITSVPAPLNVVGGGTEAAALRVTIANDSTGVLSVDDNDGSLTVDGTVVVSSGSVDVLSLPSDTFVAEGGALGKGVLIQGDDGTDRHNAQTNPDGDLKYHTNWAPSLQSDETADDSDKEFTVTAGKEWHLMWLWVEFTSGSVAGNRQVEMQLKDGSDDVIMQLQAGVTQATGLTYNYLFAPGCADLTALRDSTYLTTPIPPTIILPATYDIRVWDNNVVAAAEDDMTLQMMVLERTA